MNKCEVSECNNDKRENKHYCSAACRQIGNSRSKWSHKEAYEVLKTTNEIQWKNEERILNQSKLMTNLNLKWWHGEGKEEYRKKMSLLSSITLSRTLKRLWSQEDYIKFQREIVSKLTSEALIENWKKKSTRFEMALSRYNKEEIISLYIIKLNDNLIKYGVSLDPGYRISKIRNFFPGAEFIFEIKDKAELICFIESELFSFERTKAIIPCFEGSLEIVDSENLINMLNFINLIIGGKE